MISNGRSRAKASHEWSARHARSPSFRSTSTAIVTSPLLRARQTAEIVASRLKLQDALVLDDRLAGGFDVKSCTAILADHAEARALMLVGHEPAFSLTAGSLAGDASIEIKKGALAGIELSGPSSTHGTLFCLIPPKVLAALGKA